MAATVLASRQIPAGGTINNLVVSVDFGSSRSDMVKVTVTGQSWVTTSSIVSALPIADTNYHSAEELLLEQISCTVTNLVNGTGFDLYVHAPNGTSGQYKINILGV